jgi:porin
MTIIHTKCSRFAARMPWMAALLVCTSSVWGQEPAPERDDGPSISLSAAYTGDWRRNTTGGFAVGDAYSDSIDLGLIWITDGLFGDSRMTTNLSVMHLGGGDISGQYVGDLQGVNNLEASNGWKLYESWVEFNFGRTRNTLRAGVLDMNAEFDTPVTQGIFTSSPFGIGTEFSQTGARGPVCWPTTGLGIRAAGLLGNGLAWRFGAYDGAPGTEDDAFTSTRVSGDEGALLVGEVEYASGRVHKLAFGAWSYTTGFERLDAPLTGETGEQHGNYGFYAHFDAAIGSAGDVDFDGAVRLGVAEARFNAVDRFASAAVTATHLFAARPGDSLGIGVAWAHLGDDYRALRSFDGQPSSAAETTVELTYRAELTPWLSLLPNVQFVSAPAADPRVGDAWVAGLRFELTREKSWPLLARNGIARSRPYALEQK